MATIFKLNPAPTFRATVDIPSAGEKEDLQLQVEFRRKTKDDLAAFLSAIPGRDPLEVLMEIVVCWHDCDTAFSEDELAVLLQNYPRADVRILAAYSKESTGARLGN